MKYKGSYCSIIFLLFLLSLSERAYALCQVENYRNSISDEDFIKYIYCLAIDRDPAPFEVNNFAAVLASGTMTRAQALATLLFITPEFFLKNNFAYLSPEGRIAIIYRLFLKRELESEMIPKWQQFLQKYSFLQAVLAIINTDEFRKIHPLIDQRLQMLRLVKYGSCTTTQLLGGNLYTPLDLPEEAAMLNRSECRL